MQEIFTTYDYKDRPLRNVHIACSSAVAEEAVALAKEYKSNGGLYETAVKLFDKEREAIRLLALDRKEALRGIRLLPVVYVPDGGQHIAQGYVRGVKSASSPAVSLFSSGRECRIPKTALDMARACRKLVICDDVSHTGTTLERLLDSIPDLNGEPMNIDIVIHTMYLSNCGKAGYPKLKMSEHILSRREDLKICLYAADVTSRAHGRDLVDRGEIVRSHAGRNKLFFPSRDLPSPELGSTVKALA